MTLREPVQPSPRCGPTVQPSHGTGQEMADVELGGPTANPPARSEMIHPAGISPPGPPPSAPLQTRTWFLNCPSPDGPGLLSLVNL